MENRAYAIAVGMFTLILGGALLVCLWWFSGGSQDTTRYLIVSEHSVFGLNSQAAVRYRGVRVGKVVDVDLKDSREVYIQIRVDSDLPVTRGTRARIGTPSLTGQAYVILDDSGHDPAPPQKLPGSGIPLIAMDSAVAPSLTDGAQELMARVRRSSERIEALLSEENVGRLDTTLKNLASSSAKLDQALGQTAALASDMRRFASPENARNLAETLDRVREASVRMGPAVDEFRAAMLRLNAASARIDGLGADLQGGLAGDTLPRMNQMMSELQSDTRQLSRLLDDLERSPQSLLLGKREQATGPGEVRP